MSDEQEARLIAVALERGYVTPAQVEQARAVAATLRAPLLTVLAARFLDPGQVAALTAGASAAAETVAGSAQPVAAPDHPDRIDRYPVERELARGGMGVVYVARDADLGRRVAIKLMLNADAKARGRFLREAEATAKIRHPNVVAIHGAGEHRGLPYLVMDLIEGESLQRRVKTERMLIEREAAEVALGMARGLAAAHAAGVLHRDLKPANVLIDRAGVAKVTDFGLATFADTDTLTKTGQMLGTPAYMAPEQARGAHDDVDARTDVYGIGATLYEALAGSPPFAGATPVAMLLDILKDEVPPIAQQRGEAIDPTLDAICLRCLAKEPDQRYPTAEALAADLEAWLAGEHVAVPRPRRVLMPIAAACLLLLGASVWLLGAAPPAPDPQTPTAVAAGAPSPPPPDDAARRASERLTSIRAVPDPADRLRALRRWLADHPEHPQAPEARRLEGQVLLQTPARFLAHPQRNDCRGAALHPDGRRALTYGGKRIVAWDLTTGEELRRWKMRASVGVAIHPAGRVFAAVGRSRAWIVPLEGEQKHQRFGGRRSTTMVAWSPSGELLAVGGDDGAVRVFQEQGARWKRIKLYRQHRAPVNALAFLSDDVLVTGAGPTLDRKWAGKGVGSSKCALRLFEPLRERPGRRVLQLVELRGPPMCLAALGPRSYVVGCENNRLLKYTVGVEVPQELKAPDMRGGAHHGQIRGLAARGDWIASSSGNDRIRRHNELRIWSAADHAELLHLPQRPFRLQTVTLGPARQVLVGGPQGAELWDLRALGAR